MNSETSAPDVVDYRKLLHDEFLARVAKNPSYSLRAFARDLKVSPGYLSSVLNRAKNLSQNTAVAIQDQLSWASEQKHLFSLLVKLESGVASKNREALIDEIRALQSRLDLSKQLSNLDLKVFHVIGDWYHAALLELLALKSTQHDVNSLARRLALQPKQISEALDRLCSVGLLEKKDDRWVRSEKHVVVPPNADVAIRNFHGAYLSKALASVQDQSNHERYLHTTLVSASRKVIPELEAKVDAFVRELLLSCESEPQDEVYCLSLAFHRVTSPARGGRIRAAGSADTGREDE